MLNVMYKMCDWLMEEVGYIIVDVYFMKIIEVELLIYGFGVFFLIF